MTAPPRCPKWTSARATRVARARATKGFACSRQRPTASTQPELTSGPPQPVLAVVVEREGRHLEARVEALEPRERLVEGNLVELVGHGDVRVVVELARLGEHAGADVRLEPLALPDPHGHLDEHDR